MNEEAQAAQTVVNAGLKTAEMTGRTAVATGKSVVAFVAALIKIKSNQKTAGLTKLKKLRRAFRKWAQAMLLLKAARAITAMKR